MNNIVVNTDAAINTLAILPEILLVVLAAALVLLDVLWPESRRRELGLISSISLFAIAAVSLLVSPPADASTQFVLGGMIRFDTMKQLFVTVTLVGAAIACLIATESPNIGRRGEFYAIIVVATLGACLMS